MQCSVEPKVGAEVMYTPVFRRGKGQIYPINKLGNFPGSKTIKWRNNITHRCSFYILCDEICGKITKVQGKTISHLFHRILKYFTRKSLELQMQKMFSHHVPVLCITLVWGRNCSVNSFYRSSLTSFLGSMVA